MVQRIRIKKRRNGRSEQRKMNLMSAFLYIRALYTQHIRTLVYMHTKRKWMKKEEERAAAPAANEEEFGTVEMMKKRKKTTKNCCCVQWKSNIFLRMLLFIFTFAHACNMPISMRKSATMSSLKMVDGTSELAIKWVKEKRKDLMRKNEIENIVALRERATFCHFIINEYNNVF